MHSEHKCTRFGLISLNSDWPSNELESNPHCSYLPALLCATCSSSRALNKCDNKLHSSEHLQVLLSLNSCDHCWTCTHTCTHTHTHLFLSPRVDRLVPVSTRTHVYHGLDRVQKQTCSHPGLCWDSWIIQLYNSHCHCHLETQFLFRMLQIYTISTLGRLHLPILAPTRLRRALQWIHLPTPVLGAFTVSFREGILLIFLSWVSQLPPKATPTRNKGLTRGDQILNIIFT